MFLGLEPIFYINHFTVVTYCTIKIKICISFHYFWNSKRYPEKFNNVKDLHFSIV